MRKGRAVHATSGTFVTQIFHNGKSSHGGDRVCVCVCVCVYVCVCVCVLPLYYATLDHRIVEPLCCHYNGSVDVSFFTSKYIGL